jgi:Yip1 domain
MAAPAPETAAPKSYIPIVTDAGRLVRVLFSPGRVFDEQREKPTWFLPWLVIAIVAIIVGIIQTPYTIRTIQLAVEARRPGVTLPPGALHLQAMVGAVIAPVIFLLMGAIGAGIMYVIASITGAKVRYRAMLSAEIFAQAVLIIQYALQALMLHLRGAPEAAISSVMDAQPALGLNLLLPADATTSGFMWTLLGGIGPLPIWAVVIAGIGILRLEKTKPGTAWAAAIGSYLVILLVSAGLASMQR